MKYIAFILFVAHFEASKCSVYYFGDQNRCELNMTEEIDRCEFDFINGNWKQLSTGLPKLHKCIRQCPHTELLIRFKNYTLAAFPNSTFSNIQHRKLTLEISDGSTVALLSPSLVGYRIFENSSFNSVIFYISDSSTLIGWNWTLLKNLTVSDKGFEFIVVRSKLVYLHSDFNKVAKGRITAVRILKCQLKWLGKEVFAPLVYLKTIELRDNLLRNINRSQLPRVAPELRILDLGNNKLTNLPEDIFDGLNLQTVYLNGNNLKISELLMESILSRKEKIYISGAVWPCKCEDSSIFLSKIGNTYFTDLECYSDASSNEVLSYTKECFL